MSSYKGHSLFALILALMFFHSPLMIALTLIGANVPDFDHEFKQENVYKMIILGLIVFISLYILKLPYYIGLIIVFLGVTFYFSEHRSFTHSIFGVLTLAAAISLIVIWGYELTMSFTNLDNSYIVVAILISLLGFLFLNKRVLLIFLPLYFFSLFLIDVTDINLILIVSSVFLGLLSHIVLDSLTPAGVKIFAPVSSKKVYRNFGLAATFVLILVAIIYHAPFLFNLFENYLLINN